MGKGFLLNIDFNFGACCAVGALLTDTDPILAPRKSKEIRAMSLFSSSSCSIFRQTVRYEHRSRDEEYTHGNSLVELADSS
jgi:hypothetical protein